MITPLMMKSIEADIPKMGRVQLQHKYGLSKWETEKILRVFRHINPRRITQGRRYIVDEGYFDGILDDEKQDILAFVVRYGSNNGTYLQVRVKNRHLEKLKKVKNLLQCDSPIKPKIINGNCYYVLNICSTRICTRLNELGVPTNKSVKTF